MIRILTIEREYGSGGGEIAQLLARQLGWKLWDQELTEEIARLANCPKEIVQVREERLRLALADVVGDGLASLCRAERLDRGVLVIATANSALAHQLQMDAPRVIDALNQRVGQDLVRRIRFKAM